MDITSILGVVIGLVLIVFVGITPTKLGNFWDPGSLAIVLGGAVAAVIASYPLTILKNIPKHIKILFQGKNFNTASLIDTLVEMAQLARKNGLLALEEQANQLEDPFFKQGIMMIVDATEAEDVRNLMENEVEMMDQRHNEGAGIYEKAAGYAPAFGMIGTLVGLVNMLKGMNMDSAGGASNIGPDMAVALITTFYGCMFAHLLFSPIGKKLRIRNEEEILYKQIMIEGILSIQSGDNPKFLREKLLTYLGQKERAKLSGEEGGGEDGGGKKGKKKK